MSELLKRRNHWPSSGLQCPVHHLPVVGMKKVSKAINQDSGIPYAKRLKGMLRERAVPVCIKCDWSQV